MGERFTIELHAKIDDNWHTIAKLEDSGSQNTGRLRRVAENSTVPMRVVECHE